MVAILNKKEVSCISGGVRYCACWEPGKLHWRVEPIIVDKAEQPCADKCCTEPNRLSKKYASLDFSGSSISGSFPIFGESSLYPYREGSGIQCK